jgi:hypothetical protein
MSFGGEWRPACRQAVSGCTIHLGMELSPPLQTVDGFAQLRIGMEA